MQSAGYCGCGCGERAPLASKTITARGWIKGQPIRFVYGHQGRLRRDMRYVAEDRGYPTPCWIWQGTTSTVTGYGLTKRSGRRIGAHRFVWEEANGPVPDGKDLDHLCRVRNCVNPDHLEPVTPAENARRGCGTKLTAPLVREIRALVAQGWNHQWIADAYGVTRRHIAHIRDRRAWADIP